MSFPSVQAKQPSSRRATICPLLRQEWPPHPRRRTAPRQHMQGRPMDDGPWKSCWSEAPHRGTKTSCKCSLCHGEETRRNTTKRARLARYRSGRFIFSWTATLPGIVAEAMDEAHGRKPRWNLYFVIQRSFLLRRRPRHGSLRSAAQQGPFFFFFFFFSHSCSLCSSHRTRGREQGSPCLAIADKPLRHHLFLSCFFLRPAFSCRRPKALSFVRQFGFASSSNRGRRRATSFGPHSEEKREHVCAMKCRADSSVQTNRSRWRQLTRSKTRR